MAEKEEIIFIDLIKGGCAECPHEYGNCKRCYYREEAIKKMCDAYFKAKDKGLMESERVEAALNALLEG